MSVAMCVRDAGRFLGPQLESIAAQTRCPDELVVVDDGSVDGSASVVQAFAEDSPFPVRLEVGDVSVGPIRAFERAIGATSGELVALSDQDDLWYPDKLATLEMALQQCPQVDLVYSDADLVDADGRPAAGSLWSRLEASPRRRQAVEAQPPGPLLRMSLVSGCALAFRSTLRRGALPFPSSLEQQPGVLFHDRWLALVAACGRGIRAVDERLFAFRIHDGQLTGLPERPSRSYASLGLSVEESVPYQEALFHQIQDLSQRCEVLRSSPSVLEQLDGARSLVAMRSTLPRGRLQRASIVGRALLAGRYRRSGRGIRAAGADLLRPGAMGSR